MAGSGSWHGSKSTAWRNGHTLAHIQPVSPSAPPRPSTDRRMADEAAEDSTLQFLASGAGRKGLRGFPFMPFAIPLRRGDSWAADRSVRRQFNAVFLSLFPDPRGAQAEA